MKKLLLAILFIPFVLQANSVMIEKINKTLQQLRLETSQKPRTNLNIKYDPFYHDKKTAMPHQEKAAPPSQKKRAVNGMVLSMILNKKAFINGAWYSKNQKVAQYVLTKVNEDSVVLKRKNKIIVLKLNTAHNLLIKKEVL